MILLREEMRAAKIGKEEESLYCDDLWLEKELLRDSCCDAFSL